MFGTRKHARTISAKPLSRQDNNEFLLEWYRPIVIKQLIEHCSSQINCLPGSSWNSNSCQIVDNKIVVQKTLPDGIAIYNVQDHQILDLLGKNPSVVLQIEALVETNGLENPFAKQKTA